MRFQDDIGYWINDTLHDFLFQRAIQADSYEEFDLVQAAKRQLEQDRLLQTRTKEVESLRGLLNRSTGIKQGQAMVIDRLNNDLQKEIKRGKVKNAIGWTAIAVAFGGGVWLGSK